MGYNDLRDLEKRITFCDGAPTTELSGMHDYSFVWDYTNNVAYLHATGATFHVAGLALAFMGGFAQNQQTNPNG